MTRPGSARATILNAILALQPTPEDTSVTHFALGGRDMTAIARLWKPGDVPRCRLCGECQLAAHPGARLCSVVVAAHVPLDRAELFAEADEAAPGPRRGWRPVGPLDHPWWRPDRPDAMRREMR